MTYTWQDPDANASAGLENCSGAVELEAAQFWAEENADSAFVRWIHRLMPALSAGQITGNGGYQNLLHKTYCMSDIRRLCPGIEPGGGRILKCLKANKKEMSVGCAQALQKLKAKKR